MIIKKLDKASKISDILLEAYKEKGIFGHVLGEIPELLCPKEIEKGSNEHLIYITLLVSLDYIRDANTLWNSGLKAFNNTNLRWIFNINEIKNSSFEKLAKILISCKIALRPKKDVKIWKSISDSLVELFEGRLDNFIANECQNDAVLLFYSVKYRYKKFFPNLSGDKILPLWIRCLNDFCGINLKNLDKIMIPIDIHVARTTIFLGCIENSSNGLYNIDDLKYYIDKVWEEAVSSKSGIIKLNMDEPLWILGKYGCENLSNNYCSKFNECIVNSYCLAVKKNIRVSQGKDGIHF